MKVSTTAYDSADYLDSTEALAAYLDAVFEDGDPALITHALGVAARARGMTQIAREAGISRESLDRVLRSDGNPEFNIVVRVLKALGMRLAAVPAE
jgi:probable addiction module antidote protein